MGELWISTAVLTVIVLLLRRIFRGKVPYRYLYGLWLLVVLRLCVPVSIGNSPLSLSTHLESNDTGNISGGRQYRDGPKSSNCTYGCTGYCEAKSGGRQIKNSGRPEKIKTILRHKWLKVLAEKPWLCRWNGCLCWSGWLVLWPWPLYC